MSAPLEVIFVALLGYFLVVNALYLAIAGSALSHLHQQRGREYVKLDRLLGSAATLPVSVVVPAYNEAVILPETLSAMLSSSYPEYEVIVVNDGSTDDTVDTAIREFAFEPHDVFYPAPLKTAPIRGTYRSRLHPNLWLIDKENGGTADAVNAGLNLARYPFVAHFDADCLLEPDSLMSLMRPINFAPEQTVAVGATLRIANGLHLSHDRITKVALPPRLVERFQLVEYLSSFVLNRLGWGTINAIPVISGAGGIWPKDLLMELGGFSNHYTHCDIEATIHAHALLRSRRAPYRIISAPEASVWTQAPMSWRDLVVQRKRWQRVVYEMLWSYRRLIFNPRYGYFGMLSMPYLLLFEAVGPFIEAFSYGFVLVLAVLGVLDLKLLLLFLCLSFGLTAVVRILSLLADVLYFKVYSRRDLLGLSLLALLEAPIYHVAQLPYRIWALFEFLRGEKTHEQMLRTGIAASSTVLPSAG